MDGFDFTDAKWCPYYANTLFVSDTESVKVSYYKADHRYLIFCANTKDCPVESEVAWNERLWIKAWTGSGCLEIKPDKMRFGAETFDFAVIMAEEGGV